MVRIEIPVPDDATVTVDEVTVTVEGPNGSVDKRLWYPDISIEVTGDTVVVESASDDRATRATMGTFESHIENMLHGAIEGWEYRMQSVYSHFPMQVSVQGDEVVIENFLGERSPRRTQIHGDTEIEVDDESLVLRGPDKEAVGQTAADIEQLTRVPGKDIRVFQDGVYITEKPRGGLKYE